MKVLSGVSIYLVAVCIAMLSFIPSCGATDYPNVSLGYSYEYVIPNDDAKSAEWHTAEAVALARWGFWFMTDNKAVFPLEMELETNLPINEKAWHKPAFQKVERISTSATKYTWIIDKDWDQGGPVFFMQAEPHADPGVSIRREITPSKLPPGTSTVQAKAIITFERKPTINGNPFQIGKGWIQVFSKPRSGLSTITTCQIADSSGSGYWRLIEQHDRPAYGAYLNMWECKTGTKVSISLRYTIENHTNKAIIFKPCVVVSWKPMIPWSSQLKCTRQSGSISFHVSGPNGEEFEVTSKTLGKRRWVNWRCGEKVAPPSALRFDRQSGKIISEKER